MYRRFRSGPHRPRQRLVAPAKPAPTETGVRHPPRPAARYIGEVTKELANLARADGCDTLSFLLELATIEAEIMGGLPAGQRTS